MPSASRHDSCPFCKAANYSITYRGPMASHEREKLQMEEQRVIELQIEKQVGATYQSDTP